MKKYGRYSDIPATKEELTALRSIIAATEDPFLKAFHRRRLAAKLNANKKIAKGVQS